VRRTAAGMPRSACGRQALHPSCFTEAMRATCEGRSVRAGAAAGRVRGHARCAGGARGARARARRQPLRLHAGRALRQAAAGAAPPAPAPRPGGARCCSVLVSAWVPPLAFFHLRQHCCLVPTAAQGSLQRAAAARLFAWPRCTMRGVSHFKSRLSGRLRQLLRARRAGLAAMAPLCGAAAPCVHLAQRARCSAAGLVHPALHHTTLIDWVGLGSPHTAGVWCAGGAQHHRVVLRLPEHAGEPAARAPAAARGAARGRAGAAAAERCAQRDRRRGRGRRAGAWRGRRRGVDGGAARRAQRLRPACAPPAPPAPDALPSLRPC